MKTMLWFVPLLVGVHLISVAQQPTEQEMITESKVTDHSKYAWANGKAWKVLDVNSKISEVDGIESGMMLLLRECYPKVSVSDAFALEGEISELTVSGFRMSDVVEQINSFYADSSNLRIPIVDAYEYSMKKMHGSSPAVLADYIAKLRAKYNR